MRNKEIADLIQEAVDEKYKNVSVCIGNKDMGFVLAMVYQRFNQFLRKNDFIYARQIDTFVSLITASEQIKYLFKISQDQMSEAQMSEAQAVDFICQTLQKFIQEIRDNVMKAIKKQKKQESNRKATEANVSFFKKNLGETLYEEMFLICEQYKRKRERIPARLLQLKFNIIHGQCGKTSSKKGIFKEMGNIKKLNEIFEKNFGVGVCDAKKYHYINGVNVVFHRQEIKQNSGFHVKRFFSLAFGEEYEVFKNIMELYKNNNQKVPYGLLKYRFGLTTKSIWINGDNPIQEPESNKYYKWLIIQNLTGDTYPSLSRFVDFMRQFWGVDVDTSPEKSTKEYQWGYEKFEEEK